MYKIKVKMDHTEKQISFIFLTETLYFSFRDDKEMTREEFWLFGSNICYVSHAVF
jgi:hypothetical protein